MCGILPYSVMNGETYVLIGKERGGSDRHKWDAFSGKRDSGETKTEAACREGLEESALIIDEEHGRNIKECLKNIKDKVFHLNHREGTLLLEIKNPEKITNHTFTKARSHFKDSHYREKKEVQWVKMADLVDAAVKKDGVLKISKNDKTKEIVLRPYFARIIKSEKEFLNNLSVIKA